nr:hypothetical protein [Candidatus Cyanaurora vandensis]
MTTFTTPDTAPKGTVTAICVVDLTVKLVATPLKVTDTTPTKLTPAITTGKPAPLAAGVTAVISGAVGSFKFVGASDIHNSTA